MRKIIIALVSFMMGMVLFLPYSTIFTYATEKLQTVRKLKIFFKYL